LWRGVRLRGGTEGKGGIGCTWREGSCVGEREARGSCKSEGVEFSKGKQ